MAPEQLHHQLSQRVFVDYFDGTRIAFNVEQNRVAIDFETETVTMDDGIVTFDPATCTLVSDVFFTGKPFYTTIHIK